VALGIKIVAKKLNSVRHKSAFALKNGHGDLSTKMRTLVKIILCFIEAHIRNSKSLKANSHVPCCAHAVPLPCHAALIHTCHAAPLPFSDSAVSFAKVRVIAGNIRTASPTV
jgi:hypothetical protein